MDYARLPYVNYRPAILSARRPVFDPAQGSWQVEVENFGLSSSSADTRILILSDGRKLAEATITALAPYASTTLTIKGNAPVTNAKTEVRFLLKDRQTGETLFD